MNTAMFRAKCVIILCLLTRIHCNMESFSVGGTKASIHQYPHSVYIGIYCKKGETDAWICGASILNQILLLTAAHCIDSCKNYQKIIINAGSSKINEGFKTTAQLYLIHETYNDRTTEDDIALIRMKARAPFNHALRRVAIMTNPPGQTNAYIAGWGLVDDKKMKQTDYLMELNQKVWRKHDCEYYVGPLPKSCLCAASLNTNHYAASGDSGSALIINGYIQIGIVSYKVPKKSKFLAVYTNVSYYFDWIRTNSRKLYCN